MPLSLRQAIEKRRLGSGVGNALIRGVISIAQACASALPFLPAREVTGLKGAQSSIHQTNPLDDAEPDVRLSTATFRSLVQSASGSSQKAKPRPAKRESVNDAAAVEAPDAPTKETKPPLAWPRLEPPATILSDSASSGAQPDCSRHGRGSTDSTIQSADSGGNLDQREMANGIAPDVPATPSDGAAFGVAFEARLHPIPTATSSMEQATPADRGNNKKGLDGNGNSGEPVRNDQGSARKPELSEQPKAARTTAPATPNEKQGNEPHGEPNRHTSEPAVATESSAARTPDISLQSGVAASLPVNPTAAPVPAPTANTPRWPAPHQAAQPAAPVPVPDPASAPPPANDLKIAINDNGQRVELHVSERAGDIHVNVRTPDSQLATAMREDLPALGAKLEQSGFHAEMWRPAASGSESRALDTTASAGNSASDSRQESSGQRQQQQQQDPRNPQPNNRKSTGKEFSWLLDSIR